MAQYSIVLSAVFLLCVQVQTAPIQETYSIRETGAPNSMSYAAYFWNKNGPISPFHDIPLYADQQNNIFNMVIEIPRWTNEKMEINKGESLNPIMQDVKKGKVRFVHQLFPYHGYIWNYGAFPQTWEDPNQKDPHTGNIGDNDPIDVCDISTTVAKRGEVRQVKVLGVMGLIDEGETDWKILVIDVKDLLAAQMNDIEDVEKHMPGLVKATHDWFKFYKVPAGKPANKFAFNGQAKNKVFTLNVIKETHENWRKLIHGETANNQNIALENVAVVGSPYNISQTEAQAIFDKAPSLVDPVPVDPSVNNWHFVDRSKFCDKSEEECDDDDDDEDDDDDDDDDEDCD